ncbi:nicotinate-nucleotide adenylyltransferase [Kangiella sediminilitoris]|uniref:Probable nicotinate-nucleotide adenylyltransferase n=1 Tax=Kangiella sediminilitoris TaxID=1144748 RepID=A0A1B3BD96_9GAMM|nr:nicotinate-nucleotide adenylyltransferase [Kangiella sediminilitoris]AOE50786.1 putative nicotinate-nucleotide adenylyltransferase [Kangiella sediminilitoris]
MLQQKKMDIILGGTFDPVHFGHLRMTQEMLNRFPDANVSLMPAAYPPHRPEPGATPRQRIEMLERVLKQYPELKVDSRELSRPEPSYSVVTLKEIRREVGNDCLVFLMGADAFAKIDEWYQWQELIELTNILVVGRPSSEIPTAGTVATFYRQHALNDVMQLPSYSHGKVGFCQMPQLDISSSYIREQINQGFSPRFLLPDDILDYMYQHGLYGLNPKS